MQIKFRFHTVLPHLGEKAVEEHDLSKFTLVELIGYTHRYSFRRREKSNKKGRGVCNLKSKVGLGERVRVLERCP